MAIVYNAPIRCVRDYVGIVKRQVYAEVPPRVEYSLTPYGQTLRPVLDALYNWGTTHARLYHPGHVLESEPV